MIIGCTGRALLFKNIVLDNIRYTDMIDVQYSVGHNSQQIAVFANKCFCSLVVFIYVRYVHDVFTGTCWYRLYRPLVSVSSYIFIT